MPALELIIFLVTLVVALVAYRLMLIRRWR